MNVLNVLSTSWRYTPCGKEYWHESCCVTWDWMKDECTGGLYGYYSGLKQKRVLIIKPLKGMYGTEGEDLPTGDAPKQQEMTKAEGPTQEDV